MIQGFLSQQVKISVGLAYGTGTTDREGAILDMQGWDGVLVVCQLGTIASGAVTSIKMQQGANSSLTDAADLAGTAVAIADDDDGEVKFIDLYQPRERYVRCLVDKDTAACAETVTYIQYRSRAPLPVSAHGTGVAGEAHLAPAEGTA
jgi:hypothetical protein